MSLKDIAREVGVSVSAVSLALRNSPKISAERRNEIREVARRHGYVQDARLSELMGHLRTNRVDRASSTLAVLVPEITKDALADYPVIESLLQGIQQQATESAYGLDILYLADLKASPKRLENILKARGIRGVIAIPWPSGVGTLDMDIDAFSVSTAGYSIIDPMVNRVCTNYLQMMDELIEQACHLGYERIGFAMTYGHGGIGHKLFVSSFLYYSSLIDEKRRVPMLSRSEISQENVLKWVREYKPDVVISSGKVYEMLACAGIRIPEDLGFATLDIAEGPTHASGMNHRYDLVGKEATMLAINDINLNRCAVPESPKIVLIDSHFHAGETLRRVGKTVDIRIRSSMYHDSHSDES